MSFLCLFFYSLHLDIIENIFPKASVKNSSAQWTICFQQSTLTSYWNVCFFKQSTLTNYWNHFPQSICAEFISQLSYFCLMSCGLLPAKYVFRSFCFFNMITLLRNTWDLSQNSTCMFSTLISDTVKLGQGQLPLSPWLLYKGCLDQYLIQLWCWPLYDLFELILAQDHLTL